MSPRQQVFDTAELAPKQGTEFWSEVVCRSFVPLDCRPHPPAFHGSIRRLHLEDCSLSVVRSGAQTVRRTERLIATSGSGQVLLSLGVGGTGHVAQDGRDAVVRPGTFALYHSSRPYTLRFDGDFEQMVFMMPAPALDARFGGADQLTATAIGADNPLAALAGSFFAALPDAVLRAPELVVSRLSGQAGELVASMLIAASGRSGASSSHRLAMALRIRAAIERRLGDTTLDRRSLAQQFRISTRYLDDLFSDQGSGVAQHIQRRRLEWTRDALADPMRDRYQIGEIARMVGFVSQSHFSRTFAAAFGHSPRDHRRLARNGAAAAAT